MSEIIIPASSTLIWIEYDIVFNPTTQSNVMSPTGKVFFYDDIAVWSFETLGYCPDLLPNGSEYIIVFQSEMDSVLFKVKFGDV